MHFKHSKKPTKKTHSIFIHEHRHAHTHTHTHTCTHTRTHALTHTLTHIHTHTHIHTSIPPSRVLTITSLPNPGSKMRGRFSIVNSFKALTSNSYSR